MNCVTRVACAAVDPVGLDDTPKAPFGGPWNFQGSGYGEFLYLGLPYEAKRKTGAEPDWNIVVPLKPSSLGEGDPNIVYDRKMMQETQIRMEYYKAMAETAEAVLVRGKFDRSYQVWQKDSQYWHAKQEIYAWRRMSLSYEYSNELWTKQYEYNTDTITGRLRTYFAQHRTTRYGPEIEGPTIQDPKRRLRDNTMATYTITRPAWAFVYDVGQAAAIGKSNAGLDVQLTADTNDDGADEAWFRKRMHLGTKKGDPIENVIVGARSRMEVRARDKFPPRFALYVQAAQTNDLVYAQSVARIEVKTWAKDGAHGYIFELYNSFGNRLDGDVIKAGDSVDRVGWMLINSWYGIERPE